MNWMRTPVFAGAVIAAVALGGLLWLALVHAEWTSSRTSSALVNAWSATGDCPNLDAWPWHVPEADDPDCDGFTIAVEGVIGTDPLDNCANTTDPDDEADDRWPPDFDDNQVINLGDVFNVLPPYFGSSPAIPDTNGDGIIDWSPRRDLVPDGFINILDVGEVLPPIFGQTCTP